MALIAVVMKAGNLSLTNEEWVMKVGEEGDVARLLEALGDKAKLTNINLQKKEA